eukprot:15342507-Ditylum_brightwellii.AAC.1
MSNLTANHNAIQVVLDKGLTAGRDRSGGLGLKGGKDSGLLEATDSNIMHFGTSPIENWVDKGDWKNEYPGFFDLSKQEQIEIENAVVQSAAGLLLS